MPANDEPRRAREGDRTLHMHDLDSGANSTDFEVVAEEPGALGDYDLLEEIGAGGMGRVYKAKHRSIGRIVALKTLLPRYLSTPALVERFKKEAAAAAHLDHPGIVPVFRFDEVDGKCFFTMALVEGRGLDKRLRQGPLDNRRAALIVQRVAEAAAYAHRRGVVHRDLKPGNILLDRDGAVKVTDFGLARRLGEEELAAIDDSVVASHPEQAGTVIRNTRAGAIMGTPGFLAPEQATAGATVGPAADVWALGAVLYACLTGRPPFVGADAIETVMLTTDTEPVPPDEVNPDVDPDLAEICLRCLRKNPAERFASADAVAAELARWHDGLSALSAWERWQGRVARFLAGAPELVPLVAGLAVHRLGNIQEGLFVGCAIFGIGMAPRRGGLRLGVPLVAALLLFVVASASVGQWVDSPLVAGGLVSAFGFLALSVLLIGWLVTAEKGRVGNQRMRRAGVGCLILGAILLVPSIAAALGAARVREIDPGLGAATLSAERYVGRLAGWLLAVPAGLAAGTILAQLNRKLDRFGRENMPAFSVGAALLAVVASLALHEFRSDEPTPAARFNAAGPGPALSVADAVLAATVVPSAVAREVAALGAVCLKAIMLLVPMALGGLVAGLAARVSGAER